MRIKTIVILIVAILFVIVLMQNTGRIRLTFLFADIYISKLLLLLLIAGVAFVLGYMAGRPPKVKRLGGYFSEDSHTSTGFDTLSDEDKDYVR